jgi:hypothetical protein
MLSSQVFITLSLTIQANQTKYILGFGTERQRLAKDSVNSFDSCNLSLQLAANPVVTQEGFLFDKEVMYVH